MNCLFCKIINKEVPAEVIYEDNKTLCFKNINPEAPIHLLFIPKRHIEWKDSFNKEDLELLAELISGAKRVAIEQKFDEAYKLIFNVGKVGHIPHIHLHLLGGWQRDIPMHNI